MGTTARPFWSSSHFSRSSQSGFRPFCSGPNAFWQLDQLHLRPPSTPPLSDQHSESAMDGPRRRTATLSVGGGVSDRIVVFERDIKPYRLLNWAIVLGAKTRFSPPEPSCPPAATGSGSPGNSGLSEKSAGELVCVRPKRRDLYRTRARVGRSGRPASPSKRQCSGSTVGGKRESRRQPLSTSTRVSVFPVSGTRTHRIDSDRQS